MKKALSEDEQVNFRLDEVIVEFRLRFDALVRDLRLRIPNDATDKKEEKLYKILGISRTSVSNLFTPKVRVHTLEQILRRGQLSPEQKARLMLEEVCAYLCGATDTNPYRQVNYILHSPFLPAPHYQERRDCAEVFQDFLHSEGKRTLNVHGEQGNGLTHFVAFQLQKFLKSPGGINLFPDGIGYYNINPANDHDYQTRRNVIASTAQTLNALFKLPEDEADQNLAIKRLLSNKRLLLVMENVPDEPYAETFVHWLDMAHPYSKVVLISIKRLNLHDSVHLALRPFNDREALKFVKKHSPFLRSALSEIKLHTGFRPKHLDTFCNLATQEFTKAPAGFLERTVKAFCDRLRTRFEGHHLAGLRDEFYSSLVLLTITKRPISVECAAAIWNRSIEDAAAILERLVGEAWLLRSKDSEGNYSFHFLEHQVAAGALLEMPQEAHAARIRLARYLAGDCATLERYWTHGGEESLQALKDFNKLREEFWSMLLTLGEDGRQRNESAEVFCELFSSCPEVMFQLFSFSRRSRLTNRALELGKRLDGRSRDRAVYVALWFNSFEQYLDDNFRNSLAAVNERLEIARRLEDPVLIFFALCDHVRNSVRLTCEEQKFDNDVLHPLIEARKLIETAHLGDRYRCYCDFYEGWSAYYFGALDRAEALLRSAEKIADKAPDYPTKGRLLVAISRVHRKRGSLETAEQIGILAHEFGKKTQQNEIEALAARNLSRIFELRCNFPRALEYEMKWYQWKSDQKHPSLRDTQSRLLKLQRLRDTGTQ